MLQALAFLCRLCSGSRPNVPYQRCEEKVDNFRRMADSRRSPLCPALRAGRAKEEKTALRPKQKSFGRFCMSERGCQVQITTPFFLFFQFTFQEKRRLKMKTINLRNFYAALYNHDALYDVPDEVAELLILFKRREEAQRRRIYRNCRRRG